MKRRYWTVIVVLGALISSATVGWATTVYWRNNRYQLPGVYQSRVLDAILTDHKRDINALIAANQALTARVAALEARMATAETNIATNTQDIATNEADIATNAADIATNEADIATNEADIATNEADIATNEADIATNEADIATNEGDIAGNTTAIGSHVANLTTAHSYDARYVRTSDTTERVIAGQRWQGGSIIGAGFTITTAATGDYTVNFNTPFTGNVRLVAEVFDGGYVDATFISNSSVRFLVKDSAGTPVDETFEFAIFGR